MTRNHVIFCCLYSLVSLETTSVLRECFRVNQSKFHHFLYKSWFHFILKYWDALRGGKLGEENDRDEQRVGKKACGKVKGISGEGQASTDFLCRECWFWGERITKGWLRKKMTFLGGNIWVRWIEALPVTADVKLLPSFVLVWLPPKADTEQMVCLEGDPRRYSEKVERERREEGNPGCASGPVLLQAVRAHSCPGLSLEPCGTYLPSHGNLGDCHISILFNIRFLCIIKMQWKKMDQKLYLFLKIFHACFACDDS